MPDATSKPQGTPPAVRLKGWRYRLIKRYARALLRHWFAAVRVRHWDRLVAMDKSHSLLVISNHISWWDGFLLGELVDAQLRWDGHRLVEQRNLQRHGFLAHVGAYGVDRDDPRHVLRALRLTARLLRSPGNAVCLFPQGELTSAEAPIRFMGGLSTLLRRFDLPSHVRVTPVALHYGFWRNSRPEAFAQVGKPVPASVLSTGDASTPEGLASWMQEEVDDLRLAVAGREPSAFTTLHRGTWQFFDGVRRQPIEDV